MALPAARGLDPRRIRAGAYRAAHAQPAGPILMRSIVKVPAHTCETSGETQHTRTRRLGNEWADECAKKGAQLHPDFQPGWQDFLRRQWIDAKVSCKLLAAASATWPTAAAMVTEPRRPPTKEGRRAQADANRAKRNGRRQEIQKQQQKALDTHVWVELGTARRCATCVQWRAAKMGPCRGPPAGWAEWRTQAADRGHAVHSALLHDAQNRQAAAPLAFCANCGAWTATGTQGSKFSEHCQAPTEAGKQALARLAKGRHPKEGRSPPFAALAARSMWGPQTRDGDL